jgi:hypothetical protein
MPTPRPAPHYVARKVKGGWTVYDVVHQCVVGGGPAYKDRAVAESSARSATKEALAMWRP